MNFRVFSWLIALSAVAFFCASASALTLSPSSSSLDACICDTVVADFSVQSEAADTALFWISGTSDWGVVAPQQLDLVAGRTEQVHAFFTPNCFAVPGKYDFNLFARSSHDGTQKSVPVSLRVSPCVSLSAEKNHSICAGSKKAVSVLLKNDSHTAKKPYSFFAYSAAKNLVSLPQKTEVGPGSEKEVEFVFDASSASPGIYKFDFEAASVYEATNQKTTDSASISFEVEVKNCQSTSLDVPKEIEACEGEAKTVSFSARNSGSAKDSFAFSTNSSFLSVQTPSAEVLPGAEFSGKLLVPASAKKGVYPVLVSAKGALSSASASSVLRVKHCYGVEMNLSGIIDACSEQATREKLFVKNTGVGDTFSISIKGLQLGSLSQESAFIKEGETKEVDFFVPSGIKEGVYDVEFSASSSKGAKANATSKIRITRCRGVKLSAMGGNACPCINTAFQITIMNIGARDDDYVLIKDVGPDWMKVAGGNFSVKGGAKVDLASNVDIYACNITPGKYDLILSVISNKDKNVADRINIPIYVKGPKDCFSSSLSADAKVSLKECSSKVVPVRIRNTGLVENAYSLSISGEGATVTPESVSIQPNDEKIVYIALSSKINEAGQTRKVLLKAESKDVSSSLEFEVKILKQVEESNEVSAKIAPVGSNSFEVQTVAGALVTVSDGQGNSKNYTADSKGKVVVSAEPNTKWFVTVSKEGFKPVTLSYTTAPIPTATPTASVQIPTATASPTQSPATGSAILSPGNILIALFLLALLAAAYLFLTRKKDIKEPPKDKINVGERKEPSSEQASPKNEAKAEVKPVHPPAKADAKKVHGPGSAPSGEKKSFADNY